MRVLVVIPAYNEAESIAAVIDEVRACQPELEILVIDDGSSDPTTAVASSCGVRVLRLPFNLGYGAAVQTGLIYALENSYEAAILLDGDGQHNPKFMMPLIELVRSGEADLALGSRFLRPHSHDTPMARRLGITFFGALASRLTRQRITDPTSGFQVIGKRLLEFFVDGNYPYDFPDADTLIMLHYAGFRIREAPVKIRPRLQGESMHGSATKILYYIYKMFFSIFIVMLQKKAIAQGGHDAVKHQNPDLTY